MKKILALLMVAAMCFSLAACGGNEPQTDNSGSQQEEANSNTKTEKFDLYQKWLNAETGEYLTFGMDGIVALEKSGWFRFEYDEENKTVSFESTNSEIITLNVIAEDGSYKLSNDSVCFVTADNYLSESVVVGKWECKEKNSILVLNADGTAELTDFGIFTWTYDGNFLCLDGEERDWRFTYSEAEDTLKVNTGWFVVSMSAIANMFTTE